jgi:DUF4097 and DUF4098 domain-containing protein YvlB
MAPQRLTPSTRTSGARRAAALAAAVGIALLAGGCGIGTPQFSQSASASYQVGGSVTSLDVDTAGGTIEVDAGAQTTTVQVTETVHYNNTEPDAVHSLSGGVLSLSDPGCANDRCEVDYVVRVPAAVAARLSSHGGQITVHGLAGSLDAQSSGGDVTADSAASTSVTVSSAGGGVSLAFTAVPDSVDVSSSGGSATVALPAGTSYAVTEDASGGSQKVAVPVDPRSPHTVKVRSSGGDIAVVSAS